MDKRTDQSKIVDQELNDDELDLVAGGAKSSSRRWIPILTMDYGASRPGQRSMAIDRISLKSNSRGDD